MANDNSRVKIQDLTELTSLSIDDLFIVEDSEDTKKAKLLNFIRLLNADGKDVSDITYYSSLRVNELLDEVIEMLNQKIQLVNDRLNGIINLDTSRNLNISEIVDARNGLQNLRARLEADETRYDAKYFRYDNDWTNELLNKWLNNVNIKLYGGYEECHMITEQGTRTIIDEPECISIPTACVIERDEFSKIRRNSKLPYKVTVNNDAINNPKFVQQVPQTSVVTAALSFFIDKPAIEKFTATGGIKVMLSSDAHGSSYANYYSYTIHKSEMVQGWNTIKHHIDKFSKTGAPNVNAIKNVVIEIDRSDVFNGNSIWFGDITFNQKMTPTVLLAFNGIESDNASSYLYPYLNRQRIPATVFLTSGTSIGTSVMDMLIKQRLEYGWDLGCYGIYPNPDFLLIDSAYFNQYNGLKLAKEYLAGTVTSNPVSYSAPYGDLRPITMKLLQSLDYKIAMSEAEGYCGFFSKNDFSLPRNLIHFETTADSVKSKIDYAITTGQCLPLYTSDVTVYGSEIAAKKATFESIIDYIVEKRDEGVLKVMTFADFYNSCVN